MVLRTPRLSARSSNLPKLQPSHNLARYVGRGSTGRSSHSSYGAGSQDIYTVMTKEVMKLSMPAFRCGNDVILFDERRRNGQQRNLRSLNLRGSDYIDPISSERIRLSRYNEIFDAERVERLRYPKGSNDYYGTNNSYFGMPPSNYTRRGSKLVLGDIESAQKARRTSKQLQMKPLMKKDSNINNQTSNHSTDSKSENQEEVPSQEDTQERIEPYNGSENNFYNNPYDPYNQGPYGIGLHDQYHPSPYSARYGDSRGYQPQYRYDDGDYFPRSRYDEGGYLPPLNESWYQHKLNSADE